MLLRIKETIFDLDTWKVVGMAILPNGLSLAQIDTIARIAVSIISFIYILRKILKRKNNDEETSI